MTLEEYALDYSKCTTAKLHKFVQARCDPGFKQGLRRKVYIKHLKAADKRVTFRIHDLPAELQNKIYGEMLRLPPVGHWNRTCSSQILATSKAINRDAREYLYSDNEFEVKFESDRLAKPDSWYVLCITDDTKDETGWSHDLRSAHVSWHPHLRKVHQLTIVIDLSNQFPEAQVPVLQTAFKSLSFNLYSLCSFLSEQNELRKLEVQVCMKAEDQIELDKGLLWPLSLLDVSLELKAFVSSAAEEVAQERASEVNDDGVEDAEKALSKLALGFIPQDALDNLLSAINQSTSTKTFSLPTAKAILERANALRGMCRVSEDEEGHCWIRKEDIQSETAALLSAMRTTDYIDDNLHRQLNEECETLKGKYKLDGWFVDEVKRQWTSKLNSLPEAKNWLIELAWREECWWTSELSSLHEARHQLTKLECRMRRW